MALVARLVQGLRDNIPPELASGRQTALPVEPPPSPCEASVKGLCQLLQASRQPEATPAQARLGEEALTELLSDAQHARTLCDAVTAATTAIAIIAAHPEADTATCGLMRWGHLRVNALISLMHMASSEERSVALLTSTELPERAGAASVSVALLASEAARADVEGVCAAANLLRNLSMPRSSREAVGAARSGGALAACLRHACHAEPKAAMLCTATARMLVEGCPPNGLRFAAGGDGGGSGGGASAFAPVAAADLSKLHPHARAELARFVCLVTAACASAPEGVLAGLLSGDGLVCVGGHACFLLSSSHASLHREACDALRPARAAVPDEAWPAEALRVRKQGAAGSSSAQQDLLPLRDALRALVAGGTLSEADVAGI